MPSAGLRTRAAPGAAALLFALAVGAQGAEAQPRAAAVTWSTYLRAGAAQTSEALDEVEHGDRVRVLGCSDRWCEVVDDGLRGFVDRDALDLPRLPRPGEPPPRPTAAASPVAAPGGPA